MWFSLGRCMRSDLSNDLVPSEVVGVRPNLSEVNNKSESTTDSDEDDRILLIYMSRFPRISDAQDFRSRKK